MKKKEILDDHLTFPFILNHRAFKNFLAKQLTVAFANDLQLDDYPVTVQLHPPTKATAQQCLKLNRTLLAELTVNWAGSDQSISFSFPYPFHGVFIFRSGTSRNGRAEKWIWHPRMIGKPGIWLLNKYTSSQGKQELSTTPRIVYSNGSHYDILVSGCDNSRKQLVNLSILAGYGKYIEGNTPELQEILATYIENLWSRVGKPGATFRNIEKFIKESPLEDELRAVFAANQPDAEKALDEQDIGWQRLNTYSAFLVDQILAAFVQKKLQFFLKRRNSQQDNSGTGSALWATLRELDGRNLVSFKLKKDLLERGQFHYFDPINGLEALSRLSSFQRYNYQADVLERLPACYRQNHPSFQGIICPVESPESKKVGLTLHLARDVRADVLGRLSSIADEQSRNQNLGYGASLVPFYQHNDGPRAMMGAKNLKQAVPIKGAESPAITTGHEREAANIIAPLAKSDLIPACSRVSPGVDLLVAYMPWHGWNMEDAIVASSRLVEEGILDWESEEVFFRYIQPGFELTGPVFANTFEEAFRVLRYGDDHLHKPGPITPDIPIAFFKNATGEKQPILCGGDDSGELIAIKYTAPASPFLGGTLTWTVRRTFPLMVGDKLMGRYGNKGVVSKILSDKEMPCFPDDPRLPKELYGRPVDLILNPHGVISRMNLGQLLETQLGLLHRLCPAHCKIPESIGAPFASLDLDQYRHAFQSINRDTKKWLFDEHGRTRLVLSGGEPTKAPVTVGFQHIVRLKHVAAKKAQVRGGLDIRSKYPYSLVTGQPVGGRRRKGGQRLGEMEIWALSANRANQVIQNAISAKSDPFFKKTALPHGQTFQAIRDHLHAMGVELKENKQGKARLQWITLSKTKKSGKEITTKGMWELGVKSEFSCSNETCSYNYPYSVIATGKKQRSKQLFLTLGDVLKDHGLSLSEKTIKNIPLLQPGSGKKGSSGEISIYLESVSQKGKTKRINLYYSRQARSIHFGLTLLRKKYSSYTQIEKDRSEIPVSKILQAFLTCPKHTVAPLKCVRQQPVLLPVKNGLCDQTIFGNIDVSNWQSGSGGYIRLPKSLFTELDDKIQKQHPLLIALQEQFGPGDSCYLPVLQLKYRYQQPELLGKTISRQQDKFGTIYQQLISLSKKKDKDQEILQLVIQLSQLLSDRLFGKSGLIRRAGLGRRVNMSSRLVIVPDPTLDWDSCGVPTEMLIILLGPWIAEDPEILREYMSTHAAADKLIKEIFGPIISPADVSRTIEQDVLNSTFWSNGIWPDKKRTGQHLQLAYEVLEYYLAEHPEVTVLLNRQPSLHRYSMMGFHPVPLPPEEGLVLKINPLVCKGFGADFDGDEMAIHMPLTKEEQVEVEAMKPTKPWNLISVANGDPMANFDQDIVCGHFYISLSAEKRETLHNIFPASTCPTCKKLLEQRPPWIKKHGQTLVSHLCEAHPEDISTIMQKWMQLAFKTVTESGLSFGFFELDTIHKNLRPSLSRFLDKSPEITDPAALKEHTDVLGNMVKDELQTIIEKQIDAPGYGFAALALSGARGFKQTRQLVGARGLLAPGDTGFLYSPESFFIPQSLVAGMTPESSFMAAMNSRSSMVDKKMGTGRAGYLTRRLVLILWDWLVKTGDCGQTNPGRPLQSCNWRHKQSICSTCYGHLPGYKTLPDNFPAGLIAAQSFGERGTQLSMQSFHTAERKLSIDDVVALLGGRDPANQDKNWFDDESKADGFVERIKSESGYSAIDERHIRFIWLAIHLSDKKTLASAWNCSQTPISGLAGPNQKQALLAAINNETVEDFSTPLTKIITGQAPAFTNEEDHHDQN